MAHFAPVSGYHIGGDRQPGGAAELGHHLPAGETLFGAARIFGVGQNILQPFTQRDGLIQQPGAVRVDGDARIRETLFSARAVSISCSPGSTPPLSLKSLKP